MTIQKRIMNQKRHTVGYVIAGKPYTRYDAVRLAWAGKVTNAKVARNNNCPHLRGLGINLYDLPTVMAWDRQTFPVKLRM